MTKDTPRKSKDSIPKNFSDNTFSGNTVLTLPDEPNAHTPSGLTSQRRGQDGPGDANRHNGSRSSLSVFSTPELKTRFAPLSLSPSAPGPGHPGPDHGRASMADDRRPARRNPTMTAGQQIALPTAAGLLGVWASRAGAFSLHASLLYLIASSTTTGDFGSSDIQSAAISFNVETSLVLDSIDPTIKDKGAAADAPLVENTPDPEPEVKPEEKLPEPPKPDDMPVLASQEADTPVTVPEPVKPPEEKREEPKPPEEVKKVEEKKDENKKEEKRREPPRPRLASIATSSGALPTPAAGGQVSASFGQLRNYSASVRAKIAEHKPRGVESRGVVVVSFEISSSGQLLNCRVAESSGSASLDSAAIRAIQAASPFAAPPGGQNHSFTIPFKFH